MLETIMGERNRCLSWDETQEWFGLMGITPVPILYDGVWNEKLIRGLYDERRDYHDHEGYVVRTADSFSYGDFRRCVAKFVRANHVAPEKHNWFTQQIIPNRLKDLHDE
jgi:hypothetical protein